MNTTYTVNSDSVDYFAVKIDTESIFDALVTYYAEINDIPDTEVEQVQLVSWKGSDYDILQTYTIEEDD